MRPSPYAREVSSLEAAGAPDERIFCQERESGFGRVEETKRCFETIVRDEIRLLIEVGEDLWAFENPRHLAAGVTLSPRVRGAWFLAAPNRLASCQSMVRFGSPS